MIVGTAVLFVVSMLYSDGSPFLRPLQLPLHSLRYAVATMVPGGEQHRTAQVENGHTDPVFAKRAEPLSFLLADSDVSQVIVEIVDGGAMGGRSVLGKVSVPVTVLRHAAQAPGKIVRGWFALGGAPCVKAIKNKRKPDPEVLLEASFTPDVGGAGFAPTMTQKGMGGGNRPLPLPFPLELVPGSPRFFQAGTMYAMVDCVSGLRKMNSSSKRSDPRVYLRLWNTCAASECVQEGNKFAAFDAQAESRTMNDAGEEATFGETLLVPYDATRARQSMQLGTTPIVGLEVWDGKIRVGAVLLPLLAFLAAPGAVFDRELELKDEEQTGERGRIKVRLQFLPSRVQGESKGESKSADGGAGVGTTGVEDSLEDSKASVEGEDAATTGVTTAADAKAEIRAEVCAYATLRAAALAQLQPFQEDAPTQRVPPAAGGILNVDMIVARHLNSSR